MVSRKATQNASMAPTAQGSASVPRRQRPLAEMRGITEHRWMPTPTPTHSPAHLPALLQERYYAYSCLREKTLETQEGSILPSVVQLVGQSRNCPLHRSTPRNHSCAQAGKRKQHYRGWGQGTAQQSHLEAPLFSLWLNDCSHR